MLRFVIQYLGLYTERGHVMRFIGGKSLLLNNIVDVINENTKDVVKVEDLFTGSGVVNMFTIDDFNISFNDSAEVTSLTFNELNFEDLFSLDIFGKDEFSSIIYVGYTDITNSIIAKLNYVDNSNFCPSFHIELSETDDLKTSILDALNTAIGDYDPDLANFFLSDEYRNSELGEYIRMCSRTNEDILHIADIIRRGCLDFKLDPKFDLHFTKYRVKKPDEVVPIDLDAFLYDHILKVDY